MTHPGAARRRYSEDESCCCTPDSRRVGLGQPHSFRPFPSPLRPVSRGADRHRSPGYPARRWLATRSHYGVRRSGVFRANRSRALICRTSDCSGKDMCLDRCLRCVQSGGSCSSRHFSVATSLGSVRSQRYRDKCMWGREVHASTEVLGSTTSAQRPSRRRLWSPPAQ